MATKSTVPEKPEESTHQDITEIPMWTNEPGEAPQFWGTHYQCESCNGISSRSPEDIQHTDECPNGGDQ
jgi:hypothetical protein